MSSFDDEYKKWKKTNSQITDTSFDEEYNKWLKRTQERREEERKQEETSKKQEQKKTEKLPTANELKTTTSPTEQIKNNKLSTAEKIKLAEASLGDNNTLKSTEELKEQGKLKTVKTNKLAKNINENIEKKNYALEKLTSGITKGTVGIAQAGLTDAAYQAQLGKQGKRTATMYDIPQLAAEELSILKNKDLNAWQKITNLGITATSNFANTIPAKQTFNEVVNLAGRLNPNLDNDLINFDNKISKPIEKWSQEISKKGSNQDKTTRFLGDTIEVVGNMVPSIAASYISGNPNIGLAALGISAKGQATQEALNAGADLGTAVKIGDAKGLLEVGTEVLTGGLKVFGQGKAKIGKKTLDKALEGLVDKEVKNEVLNFVAKNVLGIMGEQAEEIISDLVGYAIDKGTIDPNATYTWKDLLNTILQTAASTGLLNASMGGYSKSAYLQNAAEMQQAPIVNQENSYSNKLKQQATEEINNSNAPEASKKIMLEALDKIDNVTDSDMEAIRKTVEAYETTQETTTESNELETKGDYKSDQERRQKYMQYKNDTSEYDSTVVNEVLDTIPENRNGRRTVKQWLQAADEIGKRIANLSNEEIEKIAYKSWFDIQPSKSITQYDRQAKQQVGFQKFTSDEWINTINNAVNEARTNNQVQETINQENALENRVSGDELLNAQDLIEELKNVGAEIDENGYVTVYHQTTKENADNIIKNGKMSAKEDSIFFSTSKNATQAEGRGDTKLEFKIPVENLVLDDIFDNNADVKIPLKNRNETLDVSEYISKNQKVENNQETLYNNIKIGETKNININQLSDLMSEGGYRTEDQIKNLREDIKKNGITEPIEIYKKKDGTFAIENGNHRLKIAQELGIKEVPVKMVESWENIGWDKEDISVDNIKEIGGIYNDRIGERNSNINETSRNRTGSMYNYNEPSQNNRTTGENAEILTEESNGSEQTGSIRGEENSRKQLENSNESSFNLQENKNTPGETINWNEIERPEGKFRKHYQSIIQSSNTTAEAKAIAKEMMGLDTYVPQSNTELLKKADSRISTTNADSELNSLYSKVLNNEKVSDVDIAVGERLIEYYSKIGDAAKLQDAIHTTAMAGTQAGRTVQALALLNHMTPQGQLIWLDRSITKANNELQQRYKNKENIPQFELTEDMQNKILNTETQEEMYKALDDVYEELGEQVPKTFREQIDEWRYFSMLANVKTHARNVIGNVAMGMTQRLKNKVAGAIEDVLFRNDSEIERTHTLKRTSKKTKNFAKIDVQNMDIKTQLGMNENKYNPQSRLQNARKTFKSDILNNTLGKMFDLNSKALEIEDNIGLKAAYVNSLGNYITANNIDVDNITDAQLAKARQHAIREAQEATFHQASALATALNQLGNKNNAAKFALDATVPFKKTPINIAKTGIEYSPVGLMKSAVYDIKNVRNGNITINQYIDNISKGVTGTGLALIGYALAQAGILKASGGEDDKKENYDKEQGKQQYAITIGGKTVSLDWLSPVGIPIFIGAEINQQFNKTKKENTSKSTDDDEILNKVIQKIGDIGTAFSNAAQPMSEMSMISGLTNVLSSYNKENAAANMFSNATKSYINQFVPTLLGQVARTTDEYERTTKSTKTGTLPRAVDTTVNQIKSKIPGLRQTLPTKTNIWGEDVKQPENVITKAFNNFINPSTVKDISTDKVDQELNNLYERTLESSIIPKAIDKKFAIDSQNYVLTNEEYAKYNKLYGQTTYKSLNSLINSSTYKKMNDTEKRKAIEKVYEYAKEEVKTDYAKQNKLDYKGNSMYQLLKLSNINIGKYLEYENNAGTKKAEKFDYINNMQGLTYTQKVLLYGYGANYKLSDSQLKYVKNYINSLNISKAEKEEYLKHFK